MILIKGHGGHVAAGGKDGPQPQQSMAAACGFGPGEDYTSGYKTNDYKSLPLGPFGYLFPKGASTKPTPDIAARLDRLGEAMVDTAPPGDDNSDMPAIFTYLGQFIDHDITAGTDRETDFSVIDVAATELSQHGKIAVTENVANLRTGSLDLDSIYGGAVHTGKFGKKLQEAMRFPQDRAKMFLGTSAKIEGCRPKLPKGIATDLLRLGRVTDPSREIIPLSDFKALTGDLAERFLDNSGEPIKAKAIIGDMRNDENLAVAQTHLMFLRLHNKMVDTARPEDVDLGDREEVFEWARMQVCRIYQWLIMNVYLPAVCDPDTLKDVLANNAPVYCAFRNRPEYRARRDCMMPLPLEFSVAAYRFGHSQARPDYDWNTIFGRGETDCNPSSDRADFRQLFAFTGEAKPPMFGASDRLPSNWIPEMERLLNIGNKFGDRNTRRINTFLAPALLAMAHMPPGVQANMRNLPIRNLRRGHLLNVPTAQDCLAELVANHGIAIRPLNAAQITSGPTGTAIRDGGFVHQTPLWFYVLKEAEILSNGRCLGPLGSRIVSETLAGLVIYGSGTYWDVSGSDNGRWHPSDGVLINGEPIDSLPAMMRAVGYL